MYYEQALELDPGFALAHSGYAHHFLQPSSTGNQPAREAMPQVREQAQEECELRLGEGDFVVFGQIIARRDVSGEMEKMEENRRTRRHRELEELKGGLAEVQAEFQRERQKILRRTPAAEVVRSRLASFSPPRLPIVSWASVPSIFGICF